MAFGYVAIANTPCAVIQNITALIGDGSSRAVRVGAVGCPTPTGWNADSAPPDNPVFFDKLKAAARRITGAASDAGLSGLTVPTILFLAQGPNAIWDLVRVASGFPNGALLSAPLIEQIGLSDTAGNSASLVCTGVVFEDNGDEAPRYADFIFAVTAANNNLNFIIKLFHSLTM